MVKLRGRPSALGEVQGVVEEGHWRDWTVDEVAEASGRSRSTCKVHLDALAAAGVLGVRRFRGKDLYWRKGHGR